MLLLNLLLCPTDPFFVLDQHICHRSLALFDSLFRLLKMPEYVQLYQVAVDIQGKVYQSMGIAANNASFDPRTTSAKEDLRNETTVSTNRVPTATQVDLGTEMMSNMGSEQFGFPFTQTIDSTQPQSQPPIAGLNCRNLDDFVVGFRGFEANLEAGAEMQMTLNGPLATLTHLDYLEDQSSDQ